MNREQLRDPGLQGFIFRVLSKEYNLQVGFTDTHFYIARNEHILTEPLDSVDWREPWVNFTVKWEPAHLQITIRDGAYDEAISKLESEEEKNAELNKRVRMQQTPPTIPPNSLLEWARKEAIMPTLIYKSSAHFYQTVTSILDSIQDKVKTTSSQDAFWDITKSGSKIISRRPKDETRIHPTIHQSMYDQALAKNIEIVREYPIAGGKLDFLLLGHLSSGRAINVCIEFKHAHSDDLQHGLVEQLPAYMRSKGSDYGIYCVMYFKGEHFDEPRGQDLSELNWFLYKERDGAGLSNIRVFGLDLSFPKPPSRR